MLGDNNLTQVIVDKKAINFNDPDNIGAVVYQKKDTTNSESSGFISGSTGSPIKPERQLGFTLETDIIFPNFC